MEDLKKDLMVALCLILIFIAVSAMIVGYLLLFITYPETMFISTIMALIIIALYFINNKLR